MLVEGWSGRHGAGVCGPAGGRPLLLGVLGVLGVLFPPYARVRRGKRSMYLCERTSSGGNKPPKPPKPPSEPQSLSPARTQAPSPHLRTQKRAKLDPSDSCRRR